MALVSCGGRAVVRDGESFYVLTSDEIEPWPADGTYWAHLRGLYPDAERVPAGTHPFPEVRTRMLEKWREKLGLDLMCICADPDHDNDFRSETCTILEEMLEKHPWVFDRLRQIMCSIAPPAGSDFTGAREMAAEVSAERVSSIAAAVIDAAESTDSFANYSNNDDQQ